jgi:hypothetical protein
VWCVQEVVRLFVRMGFRSKRMDRDTISKVATIYFDRDDASLTKGVRLQVPHHAPFCPASEAPARLLQGDAASAMDVAVEMPCCVPSLADLSYVGVQVFFERLQAADPFTAAPEDYIMAGTTHAQWCTPADLCVYQLGLTILCQ